jgi:thiosulfate/3-mercaptopyruvate sulfurtransferase
VLDARLIRDFDQVQEALGSGEAQVVDMRSRGRFTGRDPEPRPGIPSGHMPGALNLPFNELVGADGSLLPADQLKARITSAGLDWNRPVIGTCGSGTSACAFLIALESLGLDGWALYDGSWSDWVSQSGEIA